MKILEINKFNFPKGGADRHFLDVAELLRAHGDEVAVFAMDHPKNEFSFWAKYFVSYVGYNPSDSTCWQKMKGFGRMFYSFEARKKMKKILEEFEPDLVHIHNIYHQISPSILSVIKKKNIPIVMTVHDYHLVSPDYLMKNGNDWENIKRNFGFDFVRQKGFKNSYLKSFLALVVFIFHKTLGSYQKYIDTYIVPSKFLKDTMVRNGFSKHRIKVMPHFADAKKTQILSEKSGEKFALYAGRISRDKGVDSLIHIFKNVDGMSLYLAGSKDESFEIPRCDRIRYLGFLKKAELDAYVKKARFVVSASRLPETFGLVALEALSNGKPFVGFNSGAYGEIIENGKTGYLCRDEDEMRRVIRFLAADDELAASLGERARERSRAFGSNHYYESLAGLFSAIGQAKKDLTFRAFDVKLLSQKRG